MTETTPLDTNPALQNAKKAIPILFLTIFIAMLGLSVLFPVLGPLSRQLGLTETQAGLLSTVYSLLQFVAAPIWGAQSEKFGRKPILIIGLIGFAISFGLFGFVAYLGISKVLTGSALFAVLIATRAIGGLLSSATLPTAQAMIADSTSADNRAASMGIIGAAFGLGIIFGPALGGVLSQWGTLVPIYFSSVLAFVVSGFAAMTLHETYHPEHHVGKVLVSRRELMQGRVLLLLVIGMAYSLASVAMEQTISFYFQDILHVKGLVAVKVTAGALAILGIVGVIVQGGFIRPMIKAVGHIPLIWAGLGIMGLGMIMIAFGHSWLTITLALCLVGVGSGFVSPAISAALSLGVSEHQQGTIAGLSSSASAMGRMLGPIAGTFIYQHITPQATYISSGVVLLLLLGVALITLRPEPNVLAKPQM